MRGLQGVAACCNYCRSMYFKLLKIGFSLEKEDTAVPEIVSGGKIELRRDFVGLLNKFKHGPYHIFIRAGH